MRKRIKNWLGREIDVVRSDKRARIISPDKGSIVTRNIWVDQFGGMYCLYRKCLHELSLSSDWEYEYSMGFGVPV